MIAFNVLGTPAPKGSARAMIHPHTRKAILRPGSSKTGELKIRSWSAAVREAARDAAGRRAAPVYVGAPLTVAIVFRVARPAGHWGTGRNAGSVKPGSPAAPMTKPDIDKLARCTLDALTGIVIDDDARIASLCVVKQWAAPGTEGASIRIEAVGEGQP